MTQLNEFIKFQSFTAKNSVLGTFKLYASGCKQSDATAYQPGEVKGLNTPVLVIHDTAQVSTQMGSSLEHTVKCSQCKPNSIFPIHKTESNHILVHINHGAQWKWMKQWRAIVTSYIQNSQEGSSKAYTC